MRSRNCWWRARRLMAALLKTLRLLPYTCAVLALVAGTAAHGQEATSPQVRSRLLPPQVPGPPAIHIIQTPSPRATQPIPAQAPQMLTAARLADALTLCQRTVSLDFQVDTSALRDATWAYTQPRQQRMGNRQFEYIEYHKNDVALSLLDFGDFVMCRVGGVVESQARYAELRRNLAETLGAIRLADATEFAAFNESTMRNSPGSNPDDLYVDGAYSLEFFTQALPADAVAPGAQLVMVTSIPVPAQFRTSTN